MSNVQPQTVVEARLAAIRAEASADERVTFTTEFDLPRLMRTLRDREIEVTEVGPKIERFSSPKAGRGSIESSVATIEFTYEGDRIRAEGIWTEETSWFVVFRHRVDLTALMNAAEKGSSMPREGRVHHLNGEWLDPSALVRSLESFSWDDVFLPARMKDEIVRAARHFFEGREVYRELEIPYRRGFLLTGPPGLGKTSVARAIGATQGTGLVLVTKLADYDYEGNALADAFELARRIAPSVLCFEDLDGLVHLSNRNEFLGYLDGFERGVEGVLIVATTNTPEKLDPALTERPSRFDRKWVFKLPEASARLGYLRWRLAKTPLTPSEDAVARVAKETGGHSYAMLQELVVLAMFRHRIEEEDADTALLAAAKETRSQVSLAKRLDGDEPMGFMGRY